jgi:hypothetical protein
MYRTTGFVLLALSSGMLWGCDSPARLEDGAETLDASAGEIAVEGGEVSCGSLEPLLESLPSAHEVNGMPEAYRRCDPNGFSVAVGFGHGEEPFSGYEFTIKVLASSSAYAASLLRPEGAGAGATEIYRQLLDSSGELFRSMLTICEGYVRNPLITDGRNPLIVPVNGVDVCIRDELDPNREIWNAFGVAGGLGYHLTLRGQRARAIETTEAASAHLAPLFAQFRVHGVP